MKQPFPFNPVPANNGLVMSADKTNPRNLSTRLDKSVMPPDKGPYATKSTHPHATPWISTDSQKAHGKNRGW